MLVGQLLTYYYKVGYDFSHALVIDEVKSGSSLWAVVKILLNELGQYSDFQKLQVIGMQDYHYADTNPLGVKFAKDNIKAVADYKAIDCSLVFCDNREYLDTLVVAADEKAMAHTLINQRLRSTISGLFS